MMFLRPHFNVQRSFVSLCWGEWVRRGGEEGGGERKKKTKSMLLEVDGERIEVFAAE